MEIPPSSPNGRENGTPASSFSTQDVDEKSSSALEATSTTTPSTPSRRDVALQQAETVLESVGGESHLDGFNLLGVVANPRGTVSSLMSTSYHGRYTPSAGTTTTTNDATTTTTSDVFTGAFQSLETTLTSVTEQMEVLNFVLEDWSRQILEDDSDGHAEGLPDAQLRELPEEMRHLNLQSLQDYLERCGVAASAFEQLLRVRKEEAELMEGGGATKSMKDSRRRKETSSLSDDVVSLNAVQDIPDIFFQEEFDLSNPETFRKLLISSEDATVEPGSLDAKQQDDIPVSDWFPLLPPDAFGSSLDKVELALLHQVRSKSAEFFAESLRFAKLQEWIETLLSDVVKLQETAQFIREDMLDPMETVPGADQQRKDLRKLLHVLERTDEVLSTKGSLAGILSAQDDLAAIEQISYSRKLLAGSGGGKESQRHGCHDDREDGNDTDIALNRIQALKSVSDQLNQYEQLVVSNLRDELVEIFLGWNTALVTSVYSVNGSGNPKSPHHVQERVREIVSALKRCDDGLEKTRAAYSNRLQDMIRMTVRTTVAEFASDSAKASNSGNTVASMSLGATSMTLQSFLSCLDMLFEQLLGLLTSASEVKAFCSRESFFDRHDVGENDTRDSETSAQRSSNEPPSSPIGEVVATAAELSAKSISELLRLRKEAHSLVSLEEMKSIWDSCLQFTIKIESMNGRGSALRSTLQAQAKAFIDRKHDSNMSSLVAALDSERWTQCEVSSERQEALTRLCTGRSLATTPRKTNGAKSSSSSTDLPTKSPEAEVEGTRYKVVWSCLLLVEMVTTNIAAATHFTSLSSGIVSKVAELLRLFNSRTTNLVLGAGARTSSAKLKSINARHLSLVTQCLGMIMSLLPHVRAALMTHMPKKQHTLLNDIDQIKKEFAEHNEKVLNKFVTIIGGIVEHGLAPKIAGTDFDKRALENSSSSPVSCCVFLEGVSTNTKKMHQVLRDLLPPDHLKDVFSRIFEYVDTKIPSQLISSSEAKEINFTLPITDEGKKRLVMEVQAMVSALNELGGVLPWDFTAVDVIGKQVDYQPLNEGAEENTSTAAASEANGTEAAGENGDETGGENGLGVEGEKGVDAAGDKDADAVGENGETADEKADT